MNDHVSPPPPASISGRLVVIAMFAFAACLTALLAFYWNKHIEPFMPLQLAIEQEWEGSSPRVEGGQREISKKTPKILRVTLRVPFDPNSHQNEQIALERVNAIAEIAEDHVVLADYEVLTVNFYQENPGKVLKRRTIEAQIADLPLVDPLSRLRLAIEEEWKGSSPRVESGQRKMSKKTPKILRVTLRVPFDPSSEQSEQLTRERVNAIAGIARGHLALDDYDMLTVDLYHENPGNVLNRRTIETQIADLPVVVPEGG